MKWKTLLGLALGLVLASTWVARGAGIQDTDPPVGAIAERGTITPIDFPGATNTVPLDVNASGAIVGRYGIGSPNQVHGFLRTPAGEFSTIDFPGATFTVAAAINDEGDITGWYILPSAPTVRHGFLLKEGEFTSFDPPSSIFTNATGLSEAGDIVGRYCAANPCGSPGTGAYGGFLMTNGAFRTINVPGAIETDAFKVNALGHIAGGFLTPEYAEQLFLWSNGAFTTFALPGGPPVSLDNGGINNLGDIVGTYCDTARPCLITLAGTHGFLMRAGAFTTIDIPGAKATNATGINARGDIVGSYSDGSKFHGFLLSRGDD